MLIHWKKNNDNYNFVKKICREHIFIYDRICLIIVSNCIMVATGLLQPILAGLLVDRGLIAFNYQKFWLFLILLIANFLVGKFSSFYSVLTLAKLHFLSEISLNMAIIKHVQKMSLSYFFDKDTIYLSSRIYQDSDSIIAYLLENFVSIIFSILMVVVIGIIIGIKDIVLVCALLVAFVVYVLLYLYVGNYVYKKFYCQKELLNKFFSKLANLLNNIKFIKINSVADYMNEKIEVYSKDVVKAICDYIKVNWYFTSGCDLIKYSFIVFCIYYTGNKVFIKEFTTGEFIILLSYVSRMFDETNLVLGFLKGWKETKVSVDRVKELYNKPVEKRCGQQISKIEEICLQNISFGYNDANMLIKNWSYTFCRGNIYCIIGGNGIGKSSFLLTLIGLFQPHFGTIYYNGIDIKKLDMEFIRHNNIGFSEQEPFLLDASILENIYLDNEKSNVSELYVNYAGKQVFNRESEYISLSGGEKQKISHLRVFLKNADVLIFDEPTSVLDENSKSEFLNLLKDVKKEKIIIMVTHDKKICNFCDYVVDLNVCVNRK